MRSKTLTFCCTRCCICHINASVICDVLFQEWVSLQFPRSRLRAGRCDHDVSRCSVRSFPAYTVVLMMMITETLRCWWQPAVTPHCQAEKWSHSIQTTAHFDLGQESAFSLKFVPVSHRFHFKVNKLKIQTEHVRWKSTIKLQFCVLVLAQFFLMLAQIYHHYSRSDKLWIWHGGF